MSSILIKATIKLHKAIKPKTSDSTQIPEHHDIVVNGQNRFRFDVFVRKETIRQLIGHRMDDLEPFVDFEEVIYVWWRLLLIVPNDQKFLQ